MFGFALTEEEGTTKMQSCSIAVQKRHFDCPSWNQKSDPSMYPPTPLPTPPSPPPKRTSLIRHWSFIVTCPTTKKWTDLKMQQVSSIAKVCCRPNFSAATTPPPPEYID